MAKWGTRPLRMQMVVSSTLAASLSHIRVVDVAFLSKEDWNGPFQHNAAGQHDTTLYNSRIVRYSMLVEMRCYTF